MRKKRTNATSAWHLNIARLIEPTISPSPGVGSTTTDATPFERLKYLFKESRWRELSVDELTELDALSKLLPKKVVHAIVRHSATVQITNGPDTGAGPEKAGD
jgi:hypothetical protein